jgi:uncharacterized protein YkwD
MSSNHRTLPVQPRLATAILVALATLTLALAAAAVKPAKGFAHSGGCHVAGGIPGTHSLGQLRSATLCLINNIRQHHGLGKLHPQGKLARAAERHSSDMVHRDYFSHDSPGGGSIQTRIGGTGYFAGAHRWSYGEIIGGGTRNSGSPASVTNAWMHSPPHRMDILNGGFHDLGIGISYGFPGRGSHGATFTIDFGSRSG